MTKEEFKHLIIDSEKVDAVHIPDLKEIIETYPYFNIPRLLLTKAYKKENNINFPDMVNKTSIYAPDRRLFYFLLKPQKVEKSGLNNFNRVSKFSGNYFDMIQTIESEGINSKQSLSQLAEKLKEARLKITPAIPERKIMKDQNIQPHIEIKKTEATEENAKKLIKEKKYQEAILILNELYFNNPKKSIYFADQIRFLEKAIENLKK